VAGDETRRFERVKSHAWLWGSLAVLAAFFSSAAHAATTIRPVAIYSYDQVAHSAQGVYASMPAASGWTAVLTSENPARPSARFSGFLAAESGASDAFAEAASGGRNAGFLRNYLGRPASQLQRGVNSLQRQIDTHLAKIADPAQAVDDWASLSRQEQAGLISKWQADIARQRAQQSILQDLLNGRGP
jgi:hypothetical protein